MVLRQARTSSYDTVVENITTDDHFSDEWMARSEIIETIEKSSGLSIDLSELALFMMESRLDFLATANGLVIREIGTLAPVVDLAVPSRQMDASTRNWSAYVEDLHRRDRRLPPLIQALIALQLRLGLPDRGMRYLVEKTQLDAITRRPSRYDIKLSDGLAYTRKPLPAATKVDITWTPANTLRATFEEDSIGSGEPL
jgi:hypothetical protein